MKLLFWLWKGARKREGDGTAVTAAAKYRDSICAHSYLLTEIKEFAKTLIKIYLGKAKTNSNLFCVLHPSCRYFLTRNSYVFGSHFVVVAILESLQ